MKLLNILTVLALILPAIAFGQSDATLILPAHIDANFGEVAIVPITLSTDSTVNYAQIVVEYDSSIIRFAKANAGSDASLLSITHVDSNLPFDPVFPGTNKNILVHVAGGEANSISGTNVELLRFEFQVISHLGESPLAFDTDINRTLLSTTKQTVLNIEFTNGLFAVIPETTAVLSLETDTLNVMQGTNFDVDIDIADVWDAHSCSLSLSFDPTVIRVNSITQGSFLNNNGTDITNWSVPLFDNVAGTISNVMSTRLADTGIDGNGSLAVINFYAYEPGHANINFTTEQCMLYNPEGRKIAISQVLPMTINVYREPVAELTIPDTSGAPNRVMEIPIYISGIQYSAIISIFMSVVADTNCLIPIGVNTKGTLLENWQTPMINIKQGKLIFASAGFAKISGDGTLIKLRYVVNTQAQEDDVCTIAIDNVLLNEGDPTSIVSAGAFQVKGLQVAGNVSYYGTANPIPHVNLRLNGIVNSSASTDNEGNFGFTELLYGDYILKIDKQGANGNCITPFDAALILQHSVQLTQLSLYQMIAADVTGDKSVSPLDAANILMYAVGLIEEFPVMKSATDFWRFVPLSFAISATNWFESPDSIAYNPLTTTQFNQDFVGMIYGDVSQNWQYDNYKMLASRKDLVEISFGDVNELSENRFQLPILISSIHEVYALELAIKYEPANLQFENLEKTALAAEFHIAYNVTDDLIKIGLASAVEKDEGGTLLQLTFKKLGSEIGNITIEKAVINEREEAVITDMESSHSYQRPQSCILMQNYPNPFNNATIIEYTLPRLGHVSLEIYNLYGQRVHTLVNGLKDAGFHRITWYGFDDYQNTVASGEYILSLKIDDFQLRRKIIFVK